MATIRHTRPTYGRGTASKTRPVAGVIVSFDLTPREARALPLNHMLSRTFGAAVRYDSFVGREGGELVIRYSLKAQPFGSVDPGEIPELALAHVNNVLCRLASTGVGGN